jgi:hypothetical protein
MLIERHAASFAARNGDYAGKSRDGGKIAR